MERVEKRYYKIGEISKVCNIPIRTLHHYDKIHLLKPAKVDHINNYRYYLPAQICDINSIKYFKKAGFSLDEIKKLMKKDDLGYSQQMIKNKTKEIESNILKLRALKNKMNLYIQDLNVAEGDSGHRLEITVKEIPRSYVAYSRYVGPCVPEEFYLRFTKLNNIVEKNNLQMTGTMMAIYHDDYKDFDYEQADIEVCVEVDENTEKAGYVKPFGGFLGAVAYHYGSHRTMNVTYEKILSWLDENGLTFKGGAMENYIIDVITTSCEDEYITEIILPVEKTG